MPEIIYVLMLAVVIDLIFGEPKNQFHPVAWFGKLIELLFKNGFVSGSKSRLFKKVYGIFAALTIVFLVFVLVYLPLSAAYGCSQIVFILVSAIALKFTFSIKGMIAHASTVFNDLKKQDVSGARKSVSMLVGRDTENLDERQVVSAAVESISENMVDGIISPVFYFTIAYAATNSIPAAVSFAAAFRAVSTLDSMVGYRNERFLDLGWFSARADDVFNYIPARLSPLFFLNFNSIRVALRDHSKTKSPNSGWSMSAMAGALNVSLEKPGFYRIGDDKEPLKPDHINSALKVMTKTIIIFISFNLSLILVFNV
jgi:adenosylcobinamide-phosphate synthase